MMRFSLDDSAHLRNLPRRLTLPDDYAADVALVREQIRNLQRCPPLPLILVTPLGLAQASALSALFDRERHAVAERRPLATWPRIASWLYGSQVSYYADQIALGAERRWRRVLVFEHVWKQLFPGVQGECWRLAHWDDYHRLANHKRVLRKQLISWKGWVTDADLSWQVNLHPFHVSDPDSDRLSLETAALFYS